MRRGRAAPAAILARNASSTVLARSSFRRTFFRGQQRLQAIEVEAHELEVATLQSFSEDTVDHMPGARLLRREWSATDLVTQIRIQIPNRTTDKELAKFLMDSRMHSATAVQNETKLRNRVSFTAHRTLASTVGQVNPRIHRLQVLSKLGHKLFLIGSDFATSPNHLQHVKVELDAFLDGEPRVLDILGRRPKL